MKFSIIVPVYNFANFLPDCLAGVKNQSFDNWELIFIDDGSTDGSGTILDGYARSDDRIHVFHQENSGQFFAREKGIAMSQGEYILFLDSDDGLMPDCLEKLYEVICESKPDMIMFAYRVSYDDGKEDIERDMIFSEKKEISPKRLRENLISNNTFNALWTKAFRRELFEGDNTDYSALTGTHFGEDKIRLLYPVTVAKKTIYIPYCLYCYNYRQGSTMHSFNVDAIDRMLSDKMFSLCGEYMKKWDMDSNRYHEKIAVYYLKNYLSVYFGFRKSCQSSSDKNAFKKYPWRKRINKKALNPRYVKKLGLRDIIRLAAALLNL